MDDLLDTAAARAMRHIHRNGYLTMRMFIQTTGYPPESAEKLRDRLVQAGWIELRTGPKRFLTRTTEIHLTDDGRELAQILLKKEELAERLQMRRNLPKLEFV